MFSIKKEDGRIIRSTTSKWESFDETKKEIISEQITVEYFGMSVAQILASQAELEKLTAEGKTWFVSDSLFKRLYRLNGEAVTLEWLEHQDIQNLRAIEEAISANEDPKK